MLCVIAGEYSQPNSGYCCLCLNCFNSVHRFSWDRNNVAVFLQWSDHQYLSCVYKDLHFIKQSHLVKFHRTAHRLVNDRFILIVVSIAIAVNNFSTPRFSVVTYVSRSYKVSYNDDVLSWKQISLIKLNCFCYRTQFDSGYVPFT